MSGLCRIHIVHRQGSTLDSDGDLQRIHMTESAGLTEQEDAGRSMAQASPGKAPRLTAMGTYSSDIAGTIQGYAGYVTQSWRPTLDSDGASSSSEQVHCRDVTLERCDRHIPAAKRRCYQVTGLHWASIVSSAGEILSRFGSTKNIQ
jgi:hypothetical protein